MRYIGTKSLAEGNYTITNRNHVFFVITNYASTIILKPTLFPLISIATAPPLKGHSLHQGLLSGIEPGNFCIMAGALTALLTYNYCILWYTNVSTRIDAKNNNKKKPYPILFKYVKGNIYCLGSNDNEWINTCCYKTLVIFYWFFYSV